MAEFGIFQEARNRNESRKRVVGTVPVLVYAITLSALSLAQKWRYPYSHTRTDDLSSVSSSFRTTGSTLPSPASRPPPSPLPFAVFPPEMPPLPARQACGGGHVEVPFPPFHRDPFRVKPSLGDPGVGARTGVDVHAPAAAACGGRDPPPIGAARAGGCRNIQVSSFFFS
jgi:hypothetical protein